MYVLCASGFLARQRELREPVLGDASCVLGDALGDAAPLLGDATAVLGDASGKLSPRRILWPSGINATQGFLSKPHQSMRPQEHFSLSLIASQHP